MTKKEFLSKLDELLKVLNEEERKDILDEFGSHIDQEILNGKDEVETVKEFGNVENIAKEILDAYKIDSSYEPNQNTDIKANEIVDKITNTFKDAINTVSDTINKNIDGESFNNESGLSNLFSFLIVMSIYVFISYLAFTISNVLYANEASRVLFTIAISIVVGIGTLKTISEYSKNSSKNPFDLKSFNNTLSSVIILGGISLGWGIVGAIFRGINWLFYTIFRLNFFLFTGSLLNGLLTIITIILILFFFKLYINSNEEDPVIKFSIVDKKDKKKKKEKVERIEVSKKENKEIKFEKREKKKVEKVERINLDKQGKELEVKVYSKQVGSGIADVFNSIIVGIKDLILLLIRFVLWIIKYSLALGLFGMLVGIAVTIGVFVAIQLQEGYTVIGLNSLLLGSLIIIGTTLSLLLRKDRRRKHKKEKVKKIKEIKEIKDSKKVKEETVEFKAKEDKNIDEGKVDANE